VAKWSMAKDGRDRAAISLKLVRQCPARPNIGLTMDVHESLVFKVQIFHIGYLDSSHDLKKKIITKLCIEVMNIDR